MLVQNNIFSHNLKSLKPRQKQNNSIEKPVAFGASMSNADYYESQKRKLLYLDNPNNVQVMTSLLKTFQGMPRPFIEAAFLSCLDSDGKVNQEALNLLLYLCKGEPTFLDKLFKRDKSSAAFRKGGFRLITSCLEAAKDYNNNHCSENLAFVKNFLGDKHFSFLTSRFANPVVVIKASKDKQGHITEESMRLVKVLQNSSIMNKICFLMGNGDRVDEEYRNYVLSKVDSHEKIDEEHIKTLWLVRESGNSKALLEEVKDLKLKPKVLNKTLSLSQVDDKITVENFKTMLKHTENQELLLKVNNELFLDNNRNIRHGNVEYVEKIRPEVEWGYLLQKSVANLGKDKDGVVKKEFTAALKTFLDKNPKFKKHTPQRFVDTLNSARNSDGVIQFPAVKTLCKLSEASIKRKMLLSRLGEPNFYNDTLSIVKNKKGDIDFTAIKILDNLLEDDILPTIPYILKGAKNKDGDFSPVTAEKIKKILLSVKSTEQMDMSKFLSRCKDANGNFSEQKYKIIQSLQSVGIKSNLMKIAYALQKPDGSISVRGFNLVKDLKAHSHTHDNSLEEDLPKIIKLCRGADGSMNDDCIDCAKSLQGYKQNLKLSSLLKTVKKSDGGISKTRLKALETIITKCKVEDENTIEELMKAAVDKNGNTDFEFLKILIKIKQSGYNISHYSSLIPALKSFLKYSGVSSISKLNLLQKRDFMHKITKYNNEICDSRFQKVLNVPILPKNEDEYCETVGKLSHYIGINVKPLGLGLKEKFYQTFKEMSAPHSEFMQLDFDKHIPKLELSYPLRDFQFDVWNIISKERYSVRTQACDFFGFELKEKDETLVMNGYPKVNSGTHSIKDKDVAHLVSKLKPYVAKFTQNNKVTVAGNPKLSSQLTTIVDAFPEFLTTIGKPQHPTQHYTLDVHILKVLQNVYKNPEYSKLSFAGKQQLSLAALLHDLSKAAGVIDSSHPQDSAFDVYYLLDKLQLKEKDKCKIYQLIKNHSWLAHYNKSPNSAAAAREIAFEFRQNDAFKLASILTEADLKGVQRYDAFYKKHGATLKSAEKAIKPLVYELQKTTINLPQAKIPKVHKINHQSPFVKKIHKDGVQNTVVYLKKGVDLRKVGFDEAVKLEDLNFLVHGLDEKNSSFMFQALGLIDSNALLSTSYVNYGKGNWRAFRKQGFVLDVASSNIHAGYWRDFGSGYKKGKKDLFGTYLFRNNIMRNYFSDVLKKELKLSDRQYINLIQKIEDMSISELDVKAPRVAKAYRKIFSEMDTHKRAYGRNYNEILVSRPKIQAVFCYDQAPELVPVWLRRYANKNNIPILVFE